MSKPAAKRYAKAIYSLATEQQCISEVSKDMQLIKATLHESKPLRSVLSSPVITTEQKRNVAVSVFEQVQPLTLQAIELLCTNQRIAILSHVASQFMEYYNEAHQIQYARVISATALTPALEKSIQEKIKELVGSTAILTSEIDTSILGGFILRVNDLQYDASLANQLNKVKRELVN